MGPHGAPGPPPGAANLPGPSVSFFGCFFETETQSIGRFSPDPDLAIFGVGRVGKSMVVDKVALVGPA